MTPSAPPARAPLGLPLVVWGLGFVSLLTDASADIVYPLLPGLLGSMGAGAFALGLMEGVAEAGSAVAKLLSGRATDRGARPGPYVVGGYALASLARPLISLAVAPWQVIALRSLDRLGKGARGAPRDALLSRVVPPERRGRAFGLHRGLDNLGAVLGAGMAFVMLGPLGLPLRTVIALALVPGVLSTLLAAWTVRAASRGPDAPPPARRDAVPPAPLPSGVRRMLVAGGLFALGASADSFLVAHLASQGLAVELLPLAWLSLQLGKSLLNVPGGAIADRLGPQRVLGAAWILYAVTYLGFAASPSAATTWTLFALYAVYYGLGEGAEKALVVGLAGPAARGRALGSLDAVTGAALLPANVAFGALYTLAPAAAFGASALLALAAATWLAVAVRPMHDAAGR